MLHKHRFFILHLFLILFLMCSFGFAQPQLYGGLKAGLNKSEIINDGHTGFYKTGFSGGPFIQLSIAEKWTSQFEMLVSFKGCRNSNTADYKVNVPYFVGLYYFDFPLLFQYHQKKVIYEVGLGFAYLRQQREDIVSKGRTNDFPNRFSRTEQSAIVGIAYAFTDNLGLDFRYSNSILPVRKEPSKQYNSVFTISLTCQTNFRKPK